MLLTHLDNIGLTKSKPTDESVGYFHSSASPTFKTKPRHTFYRTTPNLKSVDLFLPFRHSS